MNIRFNSDGTIEGLATEDTKNFLSRLGLVEDFGTSTVIPFYEDHTQRIYKIYDESGHECSECNKLKQYFWLIEFGKEHTLCCCNCLLVIRP
jgi:hypothetical protein